MQSPRLPRTLLLLDLFQNTWITRRGEGDFRGRFSVELIDIHRCHHIYRGRLEIQGSIEKLLIKARQNNSKMRHIAKNTRRLVFKSVLYVNILHSLYIFLSVMCVVFIWVKSSIVWQLWPSQKASQRIMEHFWSTNHRKRNWLYR